MISAGIGKDGFLKALRNPATKTTGEPPKVNGLYIITFETTLSTIHVIYVYEVYQKKASKFSKNTEVYPMAADHPPLYYIEEIVDSEGNAIEYNQKIKDEIINQIEKL